MVVQAAVVGDGRRFGKKAVLRAQLDTGMIDWLASEINTCQVHFSFLVYTGTNIAALDITFDSLLLGYVISDFIISRILFEVKTFLQPFQFLLLDRNQTVAESQVAFRFLLFHLAHQCQTFPNYLELFRIQDTDAVYFTFGSKELIPFIHASGIVQLCLCILLVIVTTGQCHGCKCYTDC